MTPIINPWLFYLIGISSNLTTFFAFVGGTLLLIGAIFLIAKCIVDEADDCEKYKNVIWIKWKGWTFIGLACILIAVFIPSKDTCYQMMVASMVTSDNIEKTKGAATNLVDYIVEKINELNDEEESD